MRLPETYLLASTEWSSATLPFTGNLDHNIRLRSVLESVFIALLPSLLTVRLSTHVIEKPPTTPTRCKSTPASSSSHFSPSLLLHSVPLHPRWLHEGTHTGKKRVLIVIIPQVRTTLGSALPYANLKQTLIADSPRRCVIGDRMSTDLCGRY